MDNKFYFAANARNLPKRDAGRRNKSDPYCMVFFWGRQQQQQGTHYHHQQQTGEQQLPQMPQGKRMTQALRRHFLAQLSHKRAQQAHMAASFVMQTSPLQSTNDAAWPELVTIDYHFNDMDETVEFIMYE